MDCVTRTSMRHERPCPLQGERAQPLRLRSYRASWPHLSGDNCQRESTNRSQWVPIMSHISGITHRGVPPSLPTPNYGQQTGPELVAKPSRNTTEKRLSFNQLRRLRTLAKACLSFTLLLLPPSSSAKFVQSVAKEEHIKYYAKVSF